MPDPQRPVRQAVPGYSGQQRFANLHEVGWFWRLLGLYSRHSHPVTVTMQGDEAGVLAEQTQEWFAKHLQIARDRKERYRIFDEMDTFGLVSGILDVYSEEATQKDYDRGVSVWIESKSQAMISAGDECLRNTQMEDRVSFVARRTGKRGDAFQRLIYQTGKGVLGWKRADASKVHRLEDKYGRLIGFREDGQTYRQKKRKVSWPWDYVHFRLLGKYEDAGYGTAILDALFRPWRQLTLAEDSVLMYRMRRAPDRNLILVDVGNMEEHEAVQYLNAWRKRFRKFEFIDPASPNYKKQYNPLTPLEDVFVAMRRDNTTRIESLSGAGNMGELYDLDHFRNKFFGAAKVPKAYFGFEGEINCLKLSTRIPCLDGKTRTLRQIIDQYAATGCCPWVYSYDAKKKRVIPGRVSWAGVTRTAAKVVEVELDDGRKVVCTPEHLWRTLDGRWMRADNLKPGEQLLPLRRSIRSGKSYACNKERVGLRAVANHKVRAVRHLNRRYDTGDITVKDYHNFFIADATSGGVLVHNSKATLIQQDVRFARTAKRLQRAVMYGIRQVLEIHYTLLATSKDDKAHDFHPADKAFLVQMSPISYLDEWERLELIELRYRIVEAMSRLATDMQLDPKVWAIYILLNYAKLPEELVLKLISKTPDEPMAAQAGAAGGGFESLPPRLKGALLDIDPDQRSVILESMTPVGMYSLPDKEKVAVARLMHQSPQLRKVVGDFAYYYEDEVEDAADRRVLRESIQQVDPSMLPPTINGQVLEDNYDDEPEAKQLKEDMDTIQAGKELEAILPPKRKPR